MLFRSPRNNTNHTRRDQSKLPQKNNLSHKKYQDSNEYTLHRHCHPTNILHNKKRENHWNHKRSYIHHKEKIYRICSGVTTNYKKEKFYHLLFKENPRLSFYNIIAKELKTMHVQDMISVLWIISNLPNRKYTNPRMKPQQRKSLHNRIHSRVTPPRSNTTSRKNNFSMAYSINHALSHKNYHPASEIGRAHV